MKFSRFPTIVYRFCVFLGLLFVFTLISRIGIAQNQLDNQPGIDQTHRQTMTYKNPIVPQRADPFVVKHINNKYYMTASVPEYDRIEIRRADTIQGLGTTKEIKVIWKKHDSGNMSWHIWAPEMHFIDGKWYIYFAAGKKEAIWEIRPWALSNASADPFEGEWKEEGRVITGMDSFSLDATTFEHKGKRYFIWAQKEPGTENNSDLFIAEMETPLKLKLPAVLISKPDHQWERIGYNVNEGPAILKKNGKIFLAYSASATDHNYCMGLLTADENANLLDPKSWKKTPEPVFKTNVASSQYGPGHNSFTVSEDGKHDVMIYHARNYRDVKPNPLQDPNRHMRAQIVNWKADGTPDFGEPLPDSR